jgi:hypothetical protein
MSKIEYDLGNLGEAIAGKLLSIIFNGETQKETLRGEGKGALDLQLSYPAFFDGKALKRIAVQVKTGESFARWNQKRKCWVLQGIKKEHIEKWQKSNQPVLIVWVNPRQKSEAFWRFVNKKTSSEVLYVSKSHKLRPDSLFEIDRLINRFYMEKGGLPKITLKQFDSLSSARFWAKKEYSKIKGIFTGGLGDFEISNYAFRHLTRAGRNKSHIKDSLMLLPHVRKFLSKVPHDVQVLAPETQAMETAVDNFTLIKRKVLFVYKNCRFDDIPHCIVYIRFEEIVIFPTEWPYQLINGFKTSHSMKLESIYRKEE